MNVSCTLDVPCFSLHESFLFPLQWRRIHVSEGGPHLDSRGRDCTCWKENGRQGSESSGRNIRNAAGKLLTSCAASCGCWDRCVAPTLSVPVCTTSELHKLAYLPTFKLL